MQQKTQMKRLLSFVLCMVLIAAIALTAAGCGSKSAEPTQGATAVYTDSQTLGQGKTQFTFTVADKDGNELTFEIHTDKTIVGEALQELNLIDGEESQYGLYVKTVNGITADYDKDGVFWAFYVDGEYASSGVDSTEIVPGASYAFRVE